MKCGVVPLETVPAAWAIALEETLVEGVASGSPPTLRSWYCAPSAATIRGKTEGGMMERNTKHTEDAHGMADPSPDMIKTIKGVIRRIQE